LFFIALSVTFVMATITVNPSADGAIEDISVIYNISINVSLDSTVDGNLTQVNITLPSSFTYLGTSANSSIWDNYTFTNASNVLSWSNFTHWLVNASGSIDTSMFWVNATATTPGQNYNISVRVLNATGSYETNYTVNVNDTTVPEVAPGNFTSPLNHGNNTGSLILNVSIFDNGEVGSVFFNITNATSGLQNATYVASNSFGNYWNASISTANFNDGWYNITVYANDSYAGNLNSTSQVGNVTFDNTMLPVFASNISSPSVSGNYSGNLVLNVSIFDVGLTKIQTVFFNITNATSGLQNATYVASNSFGNYWNSSISTANFPGGYYNITVYANDSAGNLNSSAQIGNVTFDNTNPVAVFTCDHESITQEKTLTCSCSGTDNLDPNPTVSFTTNPSTSTIGVQSTTCTVTDNVGRVDVPSISYTVNSNGGGSAVSGGSSSSGGGGSSSVSWSNTHIVNDLDLVKGYKKSYSAKERAKVIVSGQTHHVGVLEITQTSAKVEVASTPQQVTLNVGETRKFDVTDDEFYDLSVTLNTISGSKADVTILAINETIPPEEEEPLIQEAKNEATGNNESINDSDSGDVNETDNSGISWIWWLIFIVIIGVGIMFWVLNMKNKR